jgi:hypothetical protein
LIKDKQGSDPNTVIITDGENYITSHYAADNYTFEPGTTVTDLGNNEYEIDGAMFDLNDVEHSFSEEFIWMSDSKSEYTVQSLQVDGKSPLD